VAVAQEPSRYYGMQVTPETKSKNHNDVKPEQLLLKSHTAMGVRTEGQMGSADPPRKMDEKLKSENMQKNSSFLNILRAIRAGRCRERRYADHILIQIYSRMHHFVVKFSKFLRLRRQGGIDPPNQKPADPLHTACLFSLKQFICGQFSTHNCRYI